MRNQAARTSDPVRKGRDTALGMPVVVGLVGRGIQLSRTPRMHEVEGVRLGYRCIYRLLDTDAMGTEAPSLPEIVRAAEITGYAGLNVTYPYKKAVIPLLHEFSKSARAVGAVNTIVFRDGKRFGHNTDYWGFAESFRRGLDGAPRRRALLLGAGGAGGAVANALLDCGVETLLVADVDSTTASDLVATLNARFGAVRAQVADDLTAVARTVDGIVNATPVGTAKAPGAAIDVSLLSGRMWVADIVYFPLETELLRAAREAGCRTLLGTGMAVFQAVRAFELFTGTAPDADAMRATFDSFSA